MVVIAAVGVGACEKESVGPSQEITMPALVEKVGDRATKVQDMKMQMTFEPEGGGKVTAHIEEYSKERREVLAVTAEGVVVKAKIHYDEVRKQMRMGAHKKAEPSPLAGRGYILARENDQLVGTREDGSPATPEELEELFDDDEDFGSRDELGAMLEGRTFKTGVKVTLTTDELARLNVEDRALNARDDTDEKISAMELTLRKVQGGIAHFDVRMGMTLTAPTGRMEMTVTGTLDVDTTTGRPKVLAAKGTLKGTRDGLPFTGKADMRISDH